MFLITIRYECGGCGWRWSLEYKGKVALPEGRRIIVPADHAPCCADEE